MIEFFYSLSAQLQALIACTFTFLVTSLGAASVFLFKKINRNVMDGFLGIAAGVMIAASFFSLLNPAFDMAENLNLNSLFVVTIGFLVGAIFLYFCDKIFEWRLKKHDKLDNKRLSLLIFSIIMHNIPEGMAIGVAFGSVLYNLDGATVLSALTLAIGIGIQNFPEGAAISLPVRREGESRLKSFIIGSLSGIVEPIAGFFGALLVLKMQVVLPYLLSFAAGCMLYVVIEEIIPESQLNKNKGLIALLTLVGFSIMMILDVALG